MPAKMNIYTEDRESFIHYIQYIWKTNYIEENLEVRDLPLYRCPQIIV